MMRIILLLSLGVFLIGCTVSPSRPDKAAVPAPGPEAATVPAPSPATGDSRGPAAATPPEPALQPPVVRQSMGLEEFAEMNDEKLLQVYVGMWRPSVERIMDGHQSGKWVNPYKRQTIVGGDRRTYEVAFYLTRPPRSGQRLTENYLTPVIFRDERVIAFGRYALKKLRRGDCLTRRDATTGRCP